MLGHAGTEAAGSGGGAGGGGAGSGGEPWPVPLPGGRVISSARVADYLNEEFAHYYRVYANCEEFGLPHGGGWLDEPPWVLQLISNFRAAAAQTRGWKSRKAR